MKVSRDISGFPAGLNGWVRRTLLEAKLKKDELEKHGWVKQTTYDEPRLSEIVEAYEEMGLQVRLEPFDPDDEIGCSECMKAQPDRYKTVYTKEKKKS